MDSLQQKTLYLLSCAVNGEQAEAPLLQGIDLDALYELCKEHSITALVGSVLTPHLAAQPEQFAKWQQRQMRAVYRDMNFAHERKKILAYLEQNGIWYMPLKGIVLKQYYPKPELREFADNDILFDEAFAEQVKEYMLANGYRLKSTGEGHVDEYEKEPCFNMEMHRSLYHTNNPEFYAYYKDVKDRLIRDEDSRYAYHFSEEDFYIFMVSHTYRHYRDNGVGIRSLADIYVFNHAKEQTLDYCYIEKELEKIDTADFEKQMRALAKKAFGQMQASLSEQEERVLEYYFHSGTFGNVEFTVQNRMKALTGEADYSAKGRWKYWFRRLFDLKTYRRDFPRAYKTVVLIPFLILYRLFRGFTKTKRLKEEDERLKQIIDRQAEK